MRSDVQHAVAEMEADDEVILEQISEIQARLAGLEALLKRRGLSAE